MGWNRRQCPSIQGLGSFRRTPPKTRKGGESRNRIASLGATPPSLAQERRSRRGLDLGRTPGVIGTRGGEQAIAWIINNQLGRRNCTPEQASWLRGQRYAREKGPQGGDQGANLKNKGLTAERLGKEYKVSKS